MSTAGLLSFVDDMLEYNTIQVVKVRSRYLGLLHYGFMIAIALYISVYVFGTQKRYLAIESPESLQRITVQDPCDPMQDGDECTFPGFEGTRAVGQTCLPPKAFRCHQHEYCATSGTPQDAIGGHVGGKLLCRYWDHNSMVWPPAEKGALTIASRASLIKQQLVNTRAMAQNGTKVICTSQTDMRCQWIPPVIDHAAYAQDDAYMADLGNFTVRISHSMWAPSFPVSANSADMEGWLMKCKAGHDCETSSTEAWAPIKHLPATGGADQLFMRDIFYAATPATGQGVHGPGIDMDAVSDACPRKCNNTMATYRFMGVVLHTTIIYDNTGLVIPGSSDTNIKYQMKIFVKPSTIFHVQVVQRGSESHDRTIHHLFGPRVVFNAGGKIGTLQWNYVLIQLTAALALFGVSTTFIDFIMCYLSSKADVFYSMKYRYEYEDATEAGQHGHGLTSSSSIAKDPEYPPGMEPPPGMQVRNTETRPLLEARQ